MNETDEQQLRKLRDHRLAKQPTERLTAIPERARETRKHCWGWNTKHAMSFQFSLRQRHLIVITMALYTVQQNGPKSAGQQWMDCKQQYTDNLQTSLYSYGANWQTVNSSLYITCHKTHRRNCASSSSTSILASIACRSLRKYDTYSLQRETRRPRNELLSRARHTICVAPANVISMRQTRYRAGNYFSRTLRGFCHPQLSH